MRIGRRAALAGLLALGACSLGMPEKPNAIEIFFAADSAELPPEAKDVLDRVAKIALDEKTQARVQVLGYADSSAGERAYNQALSRGRALAVEQALVQRRVPARRIDARGMGPDEKLDDELASRRVSIRFQE